MADPRDPAVPPPMVPSARERAEQMQEDLVFHRRLTVVSAAAIAERAYLDGWNAALAAQQPAPVFNMPPTSHVPTSPVPCPRAGNECGTDTWAVGHPSPEIEQARERLRNYSSPLATISDAEKAALSDYGGPEVSGSMPAPPQPGDAERLTAIRRDIIPHAEECPGHLSDRVFLLRLLDDAQSALAESRAECERLTQERDDYRADYLRVHKEKCDLLYPETAVARLRSPTGEERECAAAIAEDIMEMLPAEKGNFGLQAMMEHIAASWIATSHSRGVREERERTLAAINAVRDANTIKGRSYSACWMNACTEIERALATPKPQEERDG